MTFFRKRVFFRKISSEKGWPSERKKTSGFFQPEGGTLWCNKSLDLLYNDLHAEFLGGLLLPEKGAELGLVLVLEPIQRGEG